MKWILFFCVGTLVAAAPPSPESEAPLTFPERYLFVVETSASMKKQDAAVRQTLFDLVHWGVDGHMQGGDTYGIWTFNEDAYPGLFPMQIWDPGQQLVLGTRASLFLKEQPFVGNTHMSKVVLKLLSVIMTAKDVNVLIITDGSEPIAGTAFDTMIQADIEKRMKEARRLKKPFVVLLSARGGDVTGYSVKLAGEPLQLPARQILPERTGPAPAPVPAPVAAAPKPPAKPIGKIISLGYVEEFVSPTTNTSPGLPPVVVSVIAPPAQVDPLVPAPASTTITGTSFTSPVATTPVVKAEPKSQGSVNPPAATANIQKSSDVPNTRLEDAAESSKTSGRVPARYSANSTETAPNGQAGERDRAEASAEAVVDPETLLVLAREKRLATGATTATSVVPTTIAVTVPPGVEPLLSAKELIIAGAVLFLAAVGLVFIFLRRAQPVHESFITRSMDKRP